ncbi:MAG: hypothetical protein WA705_29115, partial [Candidatus Ozemobacteraceae bacterium]
KGPLGEDSLPGYGPVKFMNRRMRTRMSGGVGRGRKNLPLTRLALLPINIQSAAYSPYPTGNFCLSGLTVRAVCQCEVPKTN